MTMRRRFLATVICACAALAALSGADLAIAREAPTVSPNDPTSAELIAEPNRWDGREIEYSGEVISEALERDDHAWIHVNDDAYYLRNVEEGAALDGQNSGHAVWVPIELAEKITCYGDYTHQGDVVRVRGIFNAACAEHGGDMDVHATTLEVVARGHQFQEPVDTTKAIVAVAMAAIATAFWYANRRAHHADTFGVPRGARN